MAVAVATLTLVNILWVAPRGHPRRVANDISNHPIEYAKFYEYPQIEIVAYSVSR